MDLMYNKSFFYFPRFLKKKISIFYCLLISVIIILVVCLTTKSYIEDYRQIQFDNSEKMRVAEYEKNISSKRDSNELFSENMRLNDFNVTTPKNEIINLKSRITGPRLVYRFSNHSCRTCVENDIKILKSLADTIGLDKIIILTRFESVRYLSIYIKNEKLSFNCYNFNDVLNLPIEKKSINESPCFFVLDNELKVDFAYTSTPAHTYNSLYFKRILMFFKQ